MRKPSYTHECKSACVRGRAHVQTHPKGAQMKKKKKITQLSCPVSIANKEYSAEDCRRDQWVTLLSDVPLCCCCLSLQVVSYHACVCGLFHSYVLYTLCLCPLNCRLSVVFVCAVVCGLIFSLSSFLLCLSVSLHTPRASTLANKRTETATWKGFASKSTFSLYNKHIYMYMYSCTDQTFQALNKTYCRPIPRCASLHVHEL